MKIEQIDGGILITDAKLVLIEEMTHANGITAKTIKVGDNASEISEIKAFAGIGGPPNPRIQDLKDLCEGLCKKHESSGLTKKETAELVGLTQEIIALGGGDGGCG